MSAAQRLRKQAKTGDFSFFAPDRQAGVGISVNPLNGRGRWRAVLAEKERQAFDLYGFARKCIEDGLSICACSYGFVQPGAPDLRA